MSESINFYKRAFRNKDNLIESHINFVIKAASKFKNRNFPIDDLIQEGMLGLTQACEKFDKSKGFKFSTFARRYVLNNILSYIMLNSSHVTLKKQPKTIRLFFNLAKEKEKNGILSDNLTQDEIKCLAKKLMVNSEDIININSLLSGDLNLDNLIGDDSGTTFKDNLVDETQCIEDVIANQEEQSLKLNIVHDKINELSPRQRKVINFLYFSEDQKTNVECAKEYKISSHYVANVKKRSIDKLVVSCNKALKNRLYFN